MSRAGSRFFALTALVFSACGGTSESSNGDGDQTGDGDGDAVGDGDGDPAGDGDGVEAVCERGETRVCVGPGACAGGQICRNDQSGWQSCDCGIDGSGGTSSGGSDGSGGEGTGGDGSGGEGTGGEAPTGGSGGSPSGGAPGTGGVDSTGGLGGTAGAGGEGGAGGAFSCSDAPDGVTDNYLNNGTLCGFTWTASYGADATTIDPPCGASDCFVDEICADASIPPSDDEAGVYSGVMIGWNLIQSPDGRYEVPWTATGSGLTPTFTATGVTGDIRIVIQSGGTNYCAYPTSGTAIPYSSFSVECWEGGAQSPVFSAGSPITAIGLQLNSDDSQQTITGFCLEDITVN